MDFKQESFEITQHNYGIKNESSAMEMAPCKDEAPGPMMLKLEVYEEPVGELSMEMNGRADEGMYHNSDISELKLEKNEFETASILVSNGDTDQCPHCDYKSNSEDLKRHVSFFHQLDKCLPSPKCDDVDCLTQHVTFRHTGHMPYHCPDCNYKTNEKRFLLHHIVEIHKGQPYHCPECDYKSDRRIHVEQHIKSVHLLYKCPECNHTSNKNEGHFHVHIASDHRSEKPYHCPECNYKANLGYLLEKHISLYHRSEKLDQSSECDYRSGSKICLNQHIAFINRTKRRYQCLECDYSSHQRYQLTAHVAIVHRLEMPYQCAYCDFKTGRKMNVKDHINRIHRSEKPHQCPECDYRTTRKSTINLHIASVHRSLKPFLCPECDYRSSYKYAVMKHVANKHAVHSSVKTYQSSQ